MEVMNLAVERKGRKNSPMLPSLKEREPEANEIVSLLLDFVPLAMHELRKSFHENNSSDLTIPQFRILAILNCQPMNTKGLADTLGISLPAISRTMKALSKKGLVKKAKSKSDKREAHIQLTPEGSLIVTKAKVSVKKSLSEKMGKISAPKLKKMKSGINELNEFFLGIKE